MNAMRELDESRHASASVSAQIAVVATITRGDGHAARYLATISAPFGEMKSANA
jgi:hypothetical protein